MNIQIGDIVSWEGQDAHEVLSVERSADQLPVRIEMRCIRVAPGFQQIGQEEADAPWARLGDVNWLEADEVDLLSQIK